MARRGFTNAKKGFDNRRGGLMKKANTLHRLTGAHIAILMEYNGTGFLYQSDEHFTLELQNLSAKQRFGPDHFDTVADRGSGTQNIDYTRPPSATQDAVPLLSSTSSTFTTSRVDSAPLDVQDKSKASLSMPSTHCDTDAVLRALALASG